jgi:YegS/Rv2252/BmrU family lipid kinase
MEKNVANEYKVPLKKKVLFILNPVSGGKPTDKIPDIIRSEIDTGKYDYEIKFTKHPGHAHELANNAITENIDIIVAVGGDGTVNEVASCLIQSKVVLGIVPVGSGNGLARHLGIPRSVSKAIRLINKSHHHFIDTATVNGKAFISIAGVGFDAEVARKFTDSKKRGFSGYLKIIGTTFMNYKPKKYKITLDNKTLTTKALFISIANSNQFGYNTQIAPKAKLNDGQLDVCIVQKPKWLELPLIANLVFLKMIDKSPHVSITPAKELLIERKKGKYVNLDGEAIKMKKKLHIKINPSSLKVMIPSYVEKEI